MKRMYKNTGPSEFKEETDEEAIQSKYKAAVTERDAANATSPKWEAKTRDFPSHCIFNFHSSPN